MSIFTRIWEQIQSILKIVPKRIKEFAEHTQPIVNKIKEAIESDIAITITDLIPGSADNRIREMLVVILGNVSVALTKAPNESADISEQLQDLLDEIKELPDMMRNAAYAKISALMLAYGDEWKETKEALYSLYAEIIYIKSKN